MAYILIAGLGIAVAVLCIAVLNLSAKLHTLDEMLCRQWQEFDDFLRFYNKKVKRGE